MAFDRAIHSGLISEFLNLVWLGNSTMAMRRIKHEQDTVVEPMVK
jgi:hypothetical protein